MTQTVSNKKSFVKNISSNKVFSYSKGDCNLSFTLGIDNSSQLRDFLVCLEAGVEDINKILEGMKN